MNKIEILFKAINCVIAIFIAQLTQFDVSAQVNQLYTGTLSINAGYVPENRMPFWFRANQSGDIPLASISNGYHGLLEKKYNSADNKRFDWGAAIEGKANLSQSSNLILLQAFAKLKYGIFEIKVGRSRDITGLADSTLSVGAFSVSGTALGIPKIVVGIPEYYTIPFLGKLFSIKGSFSNGMFGETVMRYRDRLIPLQNYYQEKQFYGRFGKENWKLKLHGGANHQVQWGSEKIYYSEELFTLSPLETFFYISTGKGYATGNHMRSRLGNHLGSIDLGLEYQLNSWNIFIYRQNFYDAGALYYLANIRDGLNGISLTNKGKREQGFYFEKLLFEFFFSKNQAGELWSPYTPSGDEDYYNNQQYLKGWSYKDLNLGNPLVGSRQYVREEHPNSPTEYFINNRIIAIHTAMRMGYNLWNFTVKSTYSLNYGTFATSEAGESRGRDRFPPKHGIFEETGQFSALVEVNRKLPRKMDIGLRTAFDNGNLYYNSAGFIVFVEKKF